MSFKLDKPAMFSVDGYKRHSEDVNNEQNIIASGDITMKDVDFPVHGVDNLGNEKIMEPGKDYSFPGDIVLETPLTKKEMPNFDEGTNKCKMGGFPMIDGSESHLKQKRKKKDVEYTATSPEGDVRKTVTKYKKSGDVKSTKVVDYDPTGKRTKKTKKGWRGTRTVEGRGLDAKVTDIHGRTSTRRENIKRDVGNLVKGADMVGAGMAGGIIGAGRAGVFGAKTIAGQFAKFTAGGVLGAGVGSDIATKITGGTPNDMGGTMTKQTLEGARDLASGIKTGIKNIPSNIKKKVHAKRKSKAGL